MKIFHQKLSMALCVLALSNNILPVEAHRDKDVEILRRYVVEQTLSAPIDEAEINQIVETARPDGTWPGIDYTNVKREAFQHKIHLRNLEKLAIAYQKKGCAWKGNRKVKQAFDKGVAYWVANDFQCENWWNNEIGTPTSFITMLLAMDCHLNKEQVASMLPIAKRANLQAYGARPSGDRIKLAGLQAKWGLFSRDAGVVDAMMKEIEKEIKIRHSYERGIQADFSFHHRPDRVNNTLTYGLDFVDVFSEWAYYVANTRFSFSKASLKLAVDYYLDGVCKQMVYGKLEDTGILNRDITRVQEPVMFSVTPERLMETTNYRKEELQNVVNARKGKRYSIETFAKFFWQTEYFVVQRPHYYTSVRMYSVRNKNMEEPYNNEGIYNHFRADGSNYLTLRGDEYLNMAPMTDWTCIPGTTSPLLDKMPDMWQIQKEGQTDFVGGVTDGICGAAVFDFRSPHFPLKAKKSWFFFKDEYVCLGVDIQSSCKYPIATTLNQCFLNGEVKILNGQSVQNLSKGLHKMDQVSGIWHNEVGYVFPESENVSISAEMKSGSRFKISPRSDSSKKKECADIFMARVEHGIRPRKADYVYVVLPGASVEDWREYSQHPAIKILANTAQLQAVEHVEERLVFLNGYQNFSVDLGNQRGKFGVDSPAMVMLHYAKDGALAELNVSDPTRKLGRVHLVVSGNHPLSKVGTPTAKSWYNASENQTYISVMLPQGDMAGSSVKVKFE